MYLLRFHLLEPRDYNLIERTLKKEGFISRKVPSIIFIKGIILYITQKKSWRSIGEQLGTNHIYLFTFYKNYGSNKGVEKLLHSLIERRIFLYIGEEKYINEELLNNNQDIITLTKNKISISWGEEK